MHTMHFPQNIEESEFQKENIQYMDNNLGNGYQNNDNEKKEK